MTKTLKKINSILEKHKSDLMKKYKLKEIGVFGSYIRGEQKKKSDLDILVDFYQVPDLFEFISLERHLNKLLKKQVDLVDKKGLRVELKNKILNEVIYI